MPGRDPGRHSQPRPLAHRFGGDPTILGTDVRINGVAFRIVGVAPIGFRGIVRGVRPSDVCISHGDVQGRLPLLRRFARGCNVVNMIGRLNAGISIQDAQAEMTVLARQLETRFPDTKADAES